MKKININSIIAQLLFILALGTFGSCTDWDEFKKYTKDGEIQYSGKIDSIKIFSGKERVKFKGEMNADPKIVKYKIFWNDYSDSVEYSIDKVSGVLPIEQVFEVDEGVKNFVAITYDDEGNASVPSNAVGTSYGDTYRRKINNRLIESFTFNPDNTIINWALMDLTTGAQFTEVKLPVNGEMKTITTPVTENQTVLEGVTTSTEFEYRTIFKPEPTSIDTFAVPYAQEEFIVVPQLQNRQVPFIASARDGRWGTLADWITNDAIKIHNGHGGWDEWNGNIFNVESGWGAPSITNGKIYQVMELPAGTYTFKIADLLSTNLLDTDQTYLVVAAGEELPDVEQVDTAIGYTQVHGGKSVDQLKVEFTLEEPTQVSLGYLTSQAGGTPGKFCNIRAFDFYMN
ncbi:DUF4998 domain-containing protein [Echinicola jeungdonensis]|uniref:DUF4998 domain-containing protein n=1 Tax=Echinicola jeungdonensis TaxID=709343 RepID=A0ABV5J9G8_9BACT|nr:DUF4998 domain-containing protein [Echinicola jeungdonensis]MDN3670431.1 DUF4998 domain-containing protein [Echinicola jeungdonensis]